MFLLDTNIISELIKKQPNPYLSPPFMLRADPLALKIR